MTQAITTRQPPTPQQEAMQRQKKFLELINSRRDQLAVALPQSFQNPTARERMLRVFLTAYSSQPALFQCSQPSVLAALMRAAQLGLEPDGTLGQAHLVAYGNQCQLIIGYRGMIELTRRTGLVLGAPHAHVVYKSDTFDYSLGLTPQLIHKPNLDRLDPDAIANAAAMEALGGSAPENVRICAYAVIKFKDGEVHFEVVPASMIEKIRKSSRSSSNPSSPWNVWTDWMWRKTALKQLLKQVPLSPDDQTQRLLAEAQRQDEGTFELQDSGELVALGTEPAIAHPGAASAAPAGSKLDGYVTSHGGSVNTQPAAQPPADPQRRPRAPRTPRAPTPPAQPAPSTAPANPPVDSAPGDASDAQPAEDAERARAAAEYAAAEAAGELEQPPAQDDGEPEQAPAPTPPAPPAPAQQSRPSAGWQDRAGGAQPQNPPPAEPTPPSSAPNQPETPVTRPRRQQKLPGV